MLQECKIETKILSDRGSKNYPTISKMIFQVLINYNVNVLSVKPFGPREYDKNNLPVTHF